MLCLTPSGVSDRRPQASKFFRVLFFFRERLKVSYVFWIIDIKVTLTMVSIDLLYITNLWTLNSRVKRKKKVQIW